MLKFLYSAFFGLMLTQTTTQAQATALTDQQETNSKVMLEIHGSPLTLITNPKNNNAYVGHINIVNKSEIKATEITPYFLGTSLEGQLKLIKNTCKKGLEPNAICTMDFSAKQVPVSQSSILLQGKNIINTPVDIQINERSDALGMPLGGGKVVSVSDKDKHNPFNLIISNNIMMDYFHSTQFNWLPRGISTDGSELLKKHATSTTNGAKNTKMIVAFTHQTDSAAQACTSYSINSAGVSPCTGALGEVCYNDWYLPAKDELQIIYQNWEHIGEIHPKDNDLYWSSTYWRESAWLDERAWGQNFGSYASPWPPGTLYIEKHTAKVRCVRSF